MLVKTSHGDVTVRCLGLYELDDNVPSPIIKPYSYEIKVGNTLCDIEYEYPDQQNVPVKVDLIKEPERNTVEWDQWQRYAIYKAAITHLKRQRYEMMLYGEQVRKYIQTHCLSVQHEYNKEDWKLIFKAALTPQITIDMLREVCINTFAATYDGISIIDAIINKHDPKPSKGKLNPLRVWEATALMNSHLSEQQWIELTLKERARRIVVYHLNSWYDNLILSESISNNGSI